MHVGDIEAQFHYLSTLSHLMEVSDQFHAGWFTRRRDHTVPIW